MVCCFPLLEIPMHRVRYSLFVEDISTHTERISAYPPPSIVNQFRRHETMCAHLRKLLVFVTLACWHLQYVLQLLWRMRSMALTVGF